MYKELDLFPDGDEDEEEQKAEGQKVDLNPLFDRLAKSKFRSSFYPPAAVAATACRSGTAYQKTGNSHHLSKAM